MSGFWKKFKWQQSKLASSFGLYRAFTLVEVSVSLIILSIISAATLVVINNYMDTAANAQLRLEALEAARENMEGLLALDSVSDMAETGAVESNPLIQYEITVEDFYEPITSRMWIRAVSSAWFTDTAGETQTVELTHWLTDVSKQQVIAIMNQKKKLQEYAEALIDLQEQGYELTEEQQSILDQSDVQKSDEQSVNDNKIDEPKETQPQEPQEEILCGYTMSQLNEMTFEQVWKILMECL